MYEATERHGANINAYFASLMARYFKTGEISPLVDRSDMNEEDIDLLLEFSRYLAFHRGERVAIDFCEKLHHHILDHESLQICVGRVLMLQAELFNQIGKSMSRDLYAVEAAEAFLMFDLVPAAEKALAMVRA
ncbi:hypothetical protein J2S28_004572 [Rhizobium sp. SLBN-94]|jgi:hypothetical protein|uniref:hypothetical protein n=1 Tax=Agrobacterium tumefaciens TaxID=358 RepID=UPI001110B118|nr:hypothetical protein [Agrobacterium tumefaciens]MCP2137469.1 hypothetical protein [Rhizobium sp. SLBN-94]